MCLPDTLNSVAQEAVTEMLAARLRLGFHAQVRPKSRQLVAVPTSRLMPERVFILLFPGPWEYGCEGHLANALPCNSVGRALGMAECCWTGAHRPAEAAAIAAWLKAEQQQHRRK